MNFGLFMYHNQWICIFTQVDEHLAWWCNYGFVQLKMAVFAESENSTGPQVGILTEFAFLSSIDLIYTYFIQKKRIGRDIERDITPSQ